MVLLCEIFGNGGKFALVQVSPIPYTTISVPIHSHHHKLHKLNEYFEDTHDILYQTQQIINIIISPKYYTKNNGDFTTYYETFNNPITDNQLCEFCDSIYHKYKYDYGIFDLEDEFND